MIICCVDIRALLELLERTLSGVSVALLFGHLGVGVLHGLFHSVACGLMLVLCLIEQVVEMHSLLIMGLIGESLLLLEEFTLADLLINPVLLL